MSEELFAKRMNALKKQYEGSSNDEFIRGVYMDAYKLGKEAGFNAGYNKAVNDANSFEFNDDCDLSTEILPDVDVEKFDAVDEMLNG